MGKTEIIIKWLNAEISAGRLRPGDRVPSEYELAEKLGVNKTTANKAVATLVTSGILTRGRRGSGTFVKTNAPAFRGQIMFVTSIAHPNYAKIVYGAQSAALSRGYLTILASPMPEEVNEFIGKIASSGVQGILTGCYGLLREPDGIPLIHLDRNFAENIRPRYLINPDGAAGARMAVEEFLRLGHRNLVMLSYQYQSSRIDGFIAALRDAGIPEPDKRVWICHSGREIATRLIQEMLTQVPGLTGIVTGSDDIAFQLIPALKAKGIAVPENLSVSGFGNVSQICTLFDLTSIDQHCFEMGAFAANRLIDILEKKYMKESFNELLPCDLVRRHSIRQLNNVGQANL